MNMMPKTLCVCRWSAALLVSSLLASTLHGQAKSATPPDGYSAELAEKLGADEFGMRSYVLAVLKTGPTQVDDEQQRKELFAGHFANMGRLAEEGDLVLAGPFVEGGDNRGIFVLNVQSIPAARKLVATDPAVEAGVFEVELTKWYGSAALMQVPEIHKQIQKTKIP